MAASNFKGIGCNRCSTRVGPRSACVVGGTGGVNLGSLSSTWELAKFILGPWDFTSLTGDFSALCRRRIVAGGVSVDKTHRQGEGLRL